MNNQITVLVERCTMQINIDPFFTQATLAKQKKLLGYVFQEPWRNEETIRILDAYLPQKQAQAKDAWENASKRYQKEYTSTQSRYDLTANQKRTIEAANRKMLNEVKRCKAKYERWGKIIAYYETLKTKNHF